MACDARSSRYGQQKQQRTDFQMSYTHRNSASAWRCAFAEDECELVHRTAPFCVSFIKTLAQKLHLQIVPSLLARLSSQPVGLLNGDAR